MLIALYIFVLGLFAGSALNCVIYRLNIEGESFWSGRSHCPSCKHVLAWHELVPVFSFLFLKGECRYCKKAISWQYPVVEISTALMFFLVFNFFAPGGLNEGCNFYLSIITLLYLFVITSLLIIIFVYDLKHYLIPDKILLPAIVIALLCNLFLNPGFSILNFLLAGFGAMAFFLFIFLVSRGKWMGFGDVKLALFMGFFLGYPNILVALFLAFSIGAIIGIGMILTRRKTLKSELPFGPFLILGTFIALFWGEKLINWYLSLFLLV